LALLASSATLWSTSVPTTDAIGITEPPGRLKYSIDIIWL
jgi:hypothetical protein